MKFNRRILLAVTGIAVAAAAQPAYAKKKKVEPVPIAVAVPAPAPIPARPIAPFGTSDSTSVPMVSNGVRMTPNANLNSAETTWNLRSGMNVAALNCLQPQHQPILTAYSAMLERHKGQFSAANQALESQFRKQYGANYKRIRDSHMTKVYNYFAMPPARARLCDAALDLSNSYLSGRPADIGSYASTALPQLEAAFEGFYRELESYRVNVAAWDAQYGALYGQQQTGRAYTSSAAFGTQGAVQGAVIQGQTASASGARVFDK